MARYKAIDTSPPNTAAHCATVFPVISGGNACARRRRRKSGKSPSFAAKPTPPKKATPTGRSRSSIAKQAELVTAEGLPRWSRSSEISGTTKDWIASRYAGRGRSIRSGSCTAWYITSRNWPITGSDSRKKRSHSDPEEHRTLSIENATVGRKKHQIQKWRRSNLRHFFAVNWAGKGFFYSVNV